MSATHLTKMSIEFNNNLENSCKRNRNESIVSVSSASSCHSDSSEDTEGLSRKSSVVPEPTQTDNGEQNESYRRFRSMSDGAASKSLNQEPFEVFPSLPDSVLEKMGLLSSGARERLNEEELEQKFVALSLAFTIDAATIKDRCERQRRYRDQTEANLTTEIEKLIQKANKIQPLCIDSETTELLSALLTQIEVVMKASIHATISSERYGAVQHETRISESVNVMVEHVNLLKQQRDSARRQFQYTKRVLQNCNSVEAQQTQKARTPTSNSNGKILTKRRASIATITQPMEVSRNMEIRKIVRRTSELPLRASSLARNSRPNRLELGLDLGKIKEGPAEVEPIIHESSTPSDEESNPIEDISNHEENNEEEDLDVTPLSLRQRVRKRLKKVINNIEKRYDRWAEDGTVHEICCFCALMCFSISIIVMANILIEVEFAKRGLSASTSFLSWTGVSGNTRLPKHMYQKMT